MIWLHSSKSNVHVYVHVYYNIAVYLYVIIISGVSPRLSDVFATSTITIRQNSDPYGVLSLSYTVSESDGKVSEPGSATLIIHRTGQSPPYQAPLPITVSVHIYFSIHL